MNKGNKTGIVLLLIIAAIAIWALSKSDGNGTTFFAGDTSNERVRTYAFMEGCKADLECKNFALQNGAPADVEVFCKENICYTTVTLEVKS